MIQNKSLVVLNEAEDPNSNKDLEEKVLMIANAGRMNSPRSKAVNIPLASPKYGKEKGSPAENGIKN